MPVPTLIPTSTVDTMSSRGMSGTHRYNLRCFSPSDTVLPRLQLGNIFQYTFVSIFINVNKHIYYNIHLYTVYIHIFIHVLCIHVSTGALYLKLGFLLVKYENHIKLRNSCSSSLLNTNELCEAYSGGG